MFSRRIAVGAVAVGAAAASILGATAAYAATATSVAITAGSASSGTTVTVTGTGGAATLQNLTRGIGGSCTSSSLTGVTLKVGSGQGPNGTPAGTGIAQIPGTSSTATFTGCKAMIGTASFPFTLVGDSASGSPWRIKADETTVNGETKGTVSGINVKATAPSCTFNVTGSVANSVFKNGSPSTLTIPEVTTAAASNLSVSNLTLLNGASSCLGGAVRANGDKISFASTFSVASGTSSQNPITVVAT